MIPLDKNESYWLLDDELLNALHTTTSETYSRYPDYGSLKNDIADYAGVRPEQILITPGSDAAIELITREYSRDGEVVLPIPTFYGYENILTRLRTTISPLLYREENDRFIFPLAEMIEALRRKSVRILFLCHPNNPLGCSLSIEEIRAIVDAANTSKTYIVSDEAYFEYTEGSTFLPHLTHLPHLIVLRTFSKAFALAGARVGYAIASPEIVQRLEQHMLPWPVAHTSVSAARVLLAQADRVRARRELVIAARRQFAGLLKEIPNVTVYSSDTNFILIRVPRAADIRDALLAQGSCVALGESMSHYEDAKTLLKNTLRIAIPPPGYRESLMDSLRAALH